MKKLGKRLVLLKETIEAYACNCSSCSCSSGCGCSCDWLLGAPSSDSSTKAYNSAAAYDNAYDLSMTNYAK